MAICAKCGKDTRGGFEVYDRDLPGGFFEIVIDSTPDRNFNVCDACNTAVHFKCSKWPETGCCDECAEKYHLGEPPKP